MTRKAYALPATVVRKLGLPTSAHYMQADAYFFHAVLHQASEKVTVIYPRTHEDIPQSLTMFLSGFESHEATPHNSEQALPLPVNTPSRNIARDIRISPQNMALIATETFSPTRLERYQNCPYQYYLKHILKLPDSDTPLDIGNGAMGELIHDTFETLTGLARQNGQQDPAAYISEAIQDTIGKHQSRYGKNSLKSWIVSAKAPLLLGTDQIPGILPETLKALADANLPMAAIAEEVSLGDNNALQFTVMDTTFSLTGRIDAIYAIHDSDMLLIVDYKTGAKPYAKKDLDTYKNLQLPLYILMAQKQYPNKEIVGAAIIYARHREPGIDIMAITTEGKAALDLKRKRPKVIDEIYHHDTLFHTADVVASIREGLFGLTNVPIAETFLPKRKDMCANCTYRWVCNFPERWESYRD
jgi:ATP-dependent exoDNAse (exonuclease V) beta subunit